MPAWVRLIRFQGESGQAYWASLDLNNPEVPIGTELDAYASIEELEEGKVGKKVKVAKVRHYLL